MNLEPAMQDYKSRLSDPSSRKFGTFSYLPAMTPERIRSQVEFMVAQGWTPAIEHVEPEHLSRGYWYMWKLPLFGVGDVVRILAEAKSCREANPRNHVRLVGYDKKRQTLGAAMVVYRGVPA